MHRLLSGPGRLGDRAVRHRTAEQLHRGNALGSGHQIQQRHLHRRLGEPVALHPLAHATRQRPQRPRILAHEVWREIGVDDDLDRLGALFGPCRAAVGGGLTMDRAFGR